MNATPAKPLPVPDERSEGYWSAAARGVLALPRCADCGRFALPPDTVCPECGSTDPRFAAEPVAGGATVRSWTVVHDAFLPGFAGDVPYVLVDVELDAQPGLRMIGRLVEGPGAPLHAGMRVGVAFDELAPGVMVPAFALSPSEESGKGLG
ncbi:MAG TPA: OB-fold domain-containing protein [Acidimicrobiia bacterium]|nr:OB-fold domain-containing protein [Acidimicrobiia bacterium]